MQSNELMTWDQIREVSKNGVDIGSHTHSHRVLNTIPITEQKEEMIVSQSIIGNEIGKKINLLAYPVGNYNHFSPETMKAASECGYVAGFSFNTGINYEKNFSQFDIKRISSPVNVEQLAATMAVPKLAF